MKKINKNSSEKNNKSYLVFNKESDELIDTITTTDPDTFEKLNPDKYLIDSEKQEEFFEIFFDEEDDFEDLC